MVKGASLRCCRIGFVAGGASVLQWTGYIEAPRPAGPTLGLSPSVLFKEPGSSGSALNRWSEVSGLAEWVNEEPDRTHREGGGGGG